MSNATKEPPKGWPRISAGVYYQDAKAAIDWLARAFGFDPRLVVKGEGGRIEHAELVLGGGVIMTGDPKPERGRPWAVSPKTVGGANTQCLMIYVDDVDAHCRQARAAGAAIATEPKTTDYGPEYWSDRSYEAVDLEGHHWYFAQRMRSPAS
ncbi:MAG TPA: VOC family protein [Verrucomicrobiae bacterium]|jgi:uncharacterized glyoxalase superfamily protein PhnB